MPIETLGQALAAGWRVHARCVTGRSDYPGAKRRRCDYRKELDLESLTWTRGRNFPLARLERRLMCPRCGCQEVSLMFEPPTNSVRIAG